MKKIIVAMMISLSCYWVPVFAQHGSETEEAKQRWWKNALLLLEKDKRGILPSQLGNSERAPKNESAGFGFEAKQKTDSSATSDSPEAVQTQKKAIRAANESDYEPMIALSPSNQSNLITVYMGKVAGVARPRSSFTTNSGVSWINSDVDVGWFIYGWRSDPVVAFDRAGVAYYCYMDFNPTDSQGPKQNAVVTMKSIDGGATWLDRKTPINYEGSRPGVLSDKPWIACDQSTSQYQNTVYVTWTRINYSSSSYEIMFSRKSPSDPNFSTPRVISPAVSNNNYASGSQVVVAPDGTIYVFWLKMGFTIQQINEEDVLVENQGSLWMTKSTDGGTNFSLAAQVTALGTVNSVAHTVLGGLFQRATSFPSVAIRPSGTTYDVCVAWSDNRNSKPEVLFSKSGDGGISWSSIKRMDPFALEQFLPAITSNSQGSIFITNYDRVSSTSNDIRLYVHESADGGTIFTTTTDGSSFPGITVIGPGAGDTLFTGDYMGVAANNFTFWGSWPGPVGSGSGAHNDIFGSYRGVTASIRNDISGITTNIQYDGVSRQSPYTTNYEVAGSVHTIRASDPVSGGSGTYTFQEWRDENNTLISTSQQTTVLIGNHTYTAKFSLSITVNVRNMFVDPNRTHLQGGVVNVDNVDYTTPPDGQYTNTTWAAGSVHRFEAREQMYAGYWRGFNPFSNHNGGWLFPDQSSVYTAVVTPQVQAGTYTANYRNRYDVTLTAASFIEPGGSGGTYRVNGTDRGATWTEPVWQYDGALVEPIPPAGWAFAYWSDGNTESSRVLYPTDNTSIYAVYKKLFAATSSQTTFSAGQRKTGVWLGNYPYNEDSYYLVYESGGEIWLMQSGDHDQWSTFRVSDGTGGYSAASIAVEVINGGSQGAADPSIPARIELYITYRKQIGSNYYVYSRIRSSGESGSLFWQSQVMLNESNPIPTNIDVRPVIGKYEHQWSGGDKVIVMWDAPNGMKAVEASRYASTQEWVWGDEYFPYPDLMTTRPSLSNKHGSVYPSLYHSFEYEGKIYMNEPGGGGLQVSGDPNFVNNRNSSIAVDATGRVHVAWIAYDMSRGMEVVIHRSNYQGAMSPYYVVIDDFGSIINLQASVTAHNDASNGGVSLFWSDGSINGVFDQFSWDGYKFNGWRYQPFSWVANDPSGATIAHPSVAAYQATQGTTSPYPIAFMKNDDEDGNYWWGPQLSTNRRKSKLYRRASFVDTTTRASLQLEFGDVVLTSSRDTLNEQLGFVDTRSNLRGTFMRTETFTSQQLSRANLRIAAEGDRLPQDAIMTIVAVDSASGNVLSTLFSTLLSRNSRTKIKKNINETIPVVSRPAYIELRMTGTSLSAYRASFANVEAVQGGVDTLRTSPLAKVGANVRANGVPGIFALHQSYPNPFNPTTTINFDLPEPSHISLVIYDVLGRKVVELENGMKEAGYHSVTWNAADAASGMYFARFMATDASSNVRISKVSKLLLTK